MIGQRCCIPCRKTTNLSKDVYSYAVLHRPNSTIRMNNWEVDVTKVCPFFVACCFDCMFCILKIKGERKQEAH